MRMERTVAPDQPNRAGSGVSPNREELKTAFGRLPSGVVIITSVAPNGEFTGATVSSFGSLSFDPPMVLFSLAHTSKTLSAILACGHFVAHVVSEKNCELALHFASSLEDKFSGLSCALSAHGVPILPGFHTCIDGALAEAQPAGDHQLLVGRVLSVKIGQEDDPPVAWFRRGFHSCVALPAT